MIIGKTSEKFYLSLTNELTFGYLFKETVCQYWDATLEFYALRQLSDPIGDILPLFF